MREYELEVLEQYDVEAESTRRIRGAFFCETKEGTMLLKETRISAQRASFLYKMLCSLEAAGYQNVDTPVFTKENTLISTSRDGTHYMLKKWFPGRECDVRRQSDIIAAVRNLAQLHQKAAGIRQWECGDDIRIPLGRHLKEEFLCHNRELKKIRSFIRNKVNKGKFEYLFLEYFDKIYRVALKAADRLDSSDYEALYSESVKNRTFIHGDYNYHNVLMLSDGSMATTNFDHARVDVKVQDFYYFLRKVMEKHHWDEELGKAMVDNYTEICGMTEPEREYIALKLVYPEKFWKTANAYYHSNKAWIPEKNVEKLCTAAVQTEEKIRFAENIFAFHLY